MSDLDIQSKIDQIVNYIQGKISARPSVGIILGSGLGEFVNEITNAVVIPYKDIPHLPRSTAPGHAGNLIIGNIADKYVIAMQGRLHIYEGVSAGEATILVRVFKDLGVTTLCITAACGGLNQVFKQGDIMLIRDHINFSGTSALIGTNLDKYGPRFPVMFDIYTPSLRNMLKSLALAKGIALQEGVYAGILGPNYATRSELQMLIDNRCDAIGMSVVHEAMVAAHCSMQIVGLAAITDMALPYATNHATTNEVVESGRQIVGKFKLLLVELIKQLKA